MRAPKLWWVIAAGGLGMSGAAASVFFPWPASALKTAAVPDQPTPPAPRFTEQQGWLDPVGTAQPTTLPVESASRLVADRSEIIGIYLAGHSRAYLLSALATESGQVVNDVLAGLHLTVVHDAAVGATRVFGHPENQPVDLGAVVYQGRLSLNLGGEDYPFSAGDLPLVERRFDIMTWGEWRRLHPDSDIYVGAVPSGSAANAAGSIAVQEGKSNAAAATSL